MKPFGELQKAHMKVQFRTMYYDLGFGETCVVLQEIIETAALLSEVLAEELENETKS